MVVKTNGVGSEDYSSYQQSVPPWRVRWDSRQRHRSHTNLGHQYLTNNQSHSATNQSRGEYNRTNGLQTSMQNNDSPHTNQMSWGGRRWRSSSEEGSRSSYPRDNLYPEGKLYAQRYTYTPTMLKEGTSAISKS